MSKRTKVNSEEASNNKENKELSPNKTKSTRVLNTLFFGYLSPKWKRLARVLSFSLLPLLPLISDYFRFFSGTDNLFVPIIIHIVLVPIVSYTLKPFVVKED